MIESLATVRITEAELARDVRTVLEKVEHGGEVIIEREDHPASGGDQFTPTQRPAHRRHPA